MKNSQKGFVVPLLIVIIALLVLGGGTYFYTNTKVEAPEAVAVSTTTSMCKNDNDCKAISFPTAGGFFHEKCSNGKCIIPKDIIERGQVGNIPPGVVCTMDAKQCPDGTYVGRTGPNCEFVCSTALINENASGIIKSVYIKNNKNFLDIDYVEFVPGGPNGVNMINNNPKIRTFEITSDTKLLINSFCIDKNRCPGEKIQALTLDQFSNIFNKKDYSINNVTYLKYNPWDIIVNNGIVVEISEHFMP